MRLWKFNSVVAGLLLVMSPITALGGIIVDVQFVTRNFLAPEAALTGFAAYQVDVHTDDGAFISAVDVSFEGPMHQRWADALGCSPGGFCETPVGTADGRGDSRMTPRSDAFLPIAVFEDNTRNGSPLVDTVSLKYGLGTTLSGAWGIPVPKQTISASIAYLVIPDGQSVEFNWQVATTGGAFHGTAFIPVPEPAAVAILSVLAAYLSIRRRF